MGQCVETWILDTNEIDLTDISGSALLFAIYLNHVVMTGSSGHMEAGFPRVVCHLMNRKIGKRARKILFSIWIFWYKIIQNIHDEVLSCSP